MSLVNQFAVGADPEFVIVDENSKLTRFNKEFETAAGSVGPDHGDYVAELRPTPARSTYTLTKNLQRLLMGRGWSTLADKKFKWLAGPIQTILVPDGDGDGDNWDCPNNCCCAEHCECDEGGYIEDGDTATETQPLGGHVHLDIRADNPAWDEIVDALDVQYRLLEGIDLYPMNDLITRREQGYGKYKTVTCNGEDERTDKADLDHNPHRNAHEYHMEFRTPPSWLYHPRVAMLSLTSAKLAAADPKGTLEALNNKPFGLNTLRSWYDRYTAKDVNASRVVETILKDKLKFSTETDLKTVWKKLDF